MNKHIIFKGASTALITPLKNDRIDFESFERLIEFQISSGISALLFLGTTGESPTIEDDERTEIIKFAVSTVKNRVPVIIGTGSNSTEKAKKHTKEAYALGADAALVVTPYYNKATQEGLISHYEKIAACDISIILYNVPSRTGIGIEPSTYNKLSKTQNICAVKEASTDMSKFIDTLALSGDSLCFYSGNDNLTVPMMSMGARGVISVASNIIPLIMSNLCKKCLENDYKAASSIQKNINTLVQLLFSRVNPIPIKAAAAHIGLCENELRLPLLALKYTEAISLFQEIQRIGEKLR